MEVHGTAAMSSVWPSCLSLHLYHSKMEQFQMRGEHGIVGSVPGWKVGPSLSPGSVSFPALFLFCDVYPNPYRFFLLMML